MTVLLQDAFNRTGANLGSNPVGRWNLPAPGSGTNDWALDGQAVNSSATTTGTRGWARFISPYPGTAYGEIRARLRRATTGVSTEVVSCGILAHCDRTTMADVTRIGFHHNNTLSRYELRRYTSYDSFVTIATVTEAVAGLVMDNLDREWKFRVVLQTASGSNLLLSAWISGIPIFVNYVYPNLLAGADSNNSAPGFETLRDTGSGGNLYVDNFEFDDLAESAVEVEPSLTSEATLTPVAPGTEGTATGTTPVTPDFGELVTERYFVNRVETEAGYQVTWAAFQDRRRLWRVVHNSLLASELTTLDAFLVSHNGAATPWTYDTPEGSTAKVYFVDSTFAFTRLPSPTSGAVYRCEYIVEEVG